MAIGQDDDYIRYGTPLEREDELSRKKGKLAVDQGQARRKAPWQQEVTDAEGRRRFHGAFTGGFSAGYYNTVGSKEGWAPATFSSSRSQRAERKEQLVYDFLDEDEREELKLKELSSSAEFDTFGATAAEIARRAAHKEAKGRPSAIPGAIADEIVIPSIQSIGMKLLMKMGWRQGRGIGPQHIAVASDIQRRGRRATLALSTGQIDTLPKQSSGSDPFGLFEKSTAEIDGPREEVEDADGKVLKSLPVYLSAPKTDVHGLGFTPYNSDPELGVLGDFDAQQEIESLGGSCKSSMRKVANTEDLLPGFVAATLSSTGLDPVRFSAPLIPVDFTPKHTFTMDLDLEQYPFRAEPPDVATPDPQLAKVIEGLAAFVARSGERFELVVKNKHSENPEFGFLFGGPGHDYYRRKVWEQQKIHAVQRKDPVYPTKEKAQLTGAQRGEILGEIPLSREALPNDRVKNPGVYPTTSSLSPFEGLSQLTMQMNSRFTAGGSDSAFMPVQGIQSGIELKHSSIAKAPAKYPTREESLWRPTSILCKRFNLVNPSVEKIPDPAKPRGADLSNVASHSLAAGVGSSRWTFSQASTSSTDNPLEGKHNSSEPAKEDINGLGMVSETSLDLYKAIFSDDEDDEEDKTPVEESTGKKALVTKQSNAAYAVLNRLSAEDFLESLGQELGLKVQEERIPVNVSVTLANHNTNTSENQLQLKSTLMDISDPQVLLGHETGADGGKREPVDMTKSIADEPSKRYRDLDKVGSIKDTSDPCDNITPLRKTVARDEGGKQNIIPRVHPSSNGNFKQDTKGDEIKQIPSSEDEKERWKEKSHTPGHSEDFLQEMCTKEVRCGNTSESRVLGKRKKRDDGDRKERHHHRMSKHRTRRPY